MMTLDSLLDSSVVIDLTNPGSEWHEWCTSAANAARAEGRVILSPMVIAELARGYDSLAALDDAISPREFVREQLPWEASFLAGSIFAEYRRRGGPRESLLPDFFIGAHAAVMGYRLITRDPRRVRRYFPAVDIVAPEGA
jgi:predicted nucleic acid-binding protein